MERKRPIITTHAQLSQAQQQSQELMGTKRGRFLKRQQRIKRESDPSQTSETEVLCPQFLTVPHVRVERQCSDPLPAAATPVIGNLLTVPGGNLVKQHSHPLLPSQTHQHRQQSNSSPIPVHLSGPFLPHGHIGDAERAISPIAGGAETFLSSPQESTTPSSLRVRTEELKRSSSSPQAGTRSSHCPVVRPGPALGCNYCWNTVDTHGRILRRKTKYHCPECQTNLCIVPCFQEYHERHIGQTDPMALTTSVMRVFPKTSSL